MSDQELFKGLKRGDKESIKMIYASLFPQVRNWVVDNKGSEADAYDLFQETLETILLKINDLHSNLKGLIMRISKNKWIDKLRKANTANKFKDQLVYTSNHEALSKEEEQAIKYQLKYQLMEKYFSELSSTCQELMSLLKQGLTVEQVVTQLSFSNANTLYRRKAACVERWSTLIKKDTEYPSLFE